MKEPNRYTAAIVLLLAAYLAVIVGGHIARRSDTPVTVEVVSETASQTSSAVSETSAFIDLTVDESVTEVIVPDRSFQETEPETQAPPPVRSSSLININTATREELMTLDGVGEKTADAIIAYREIAPFESVEELMEVKGIGEKKFAAVKDDICV